MENNNLLKEHLRKLEEMLLTPDIRTSATELSNILADNFFEIGSSGKILHKDRIAPEGIGVVNMQLSEFEIHPLSDEIVLTTYRIFNKETQQYTLRSSIWKYMENRWQMVFHQGTKTDSST